MARRTRDAASRTRQAVNLCDGVQRLERSEASQAFCRQLLRFAEMHQASSRAHMMRENALVGAV